MSRIAKSVFGAIAFGAILAIVLGVQTGVARQIAEMVPAEAPLFIEVRDLAELETDWRSTGFSAIHEHPAMQPFWQEMRQTRGGILPNELLGCPWGALKNAASHGAAYILWPTKSAGLGRALIADCADNPQGAFEGYAAVVRQWQASQATVRRVSLRGVTAIEGQWPVRAKQPPHFRYVLVHQQFLAVFDQRVIAEEWIGRLAGESKPALASLPEFEQVMATGNADEFSPGSIRWYVQPWQLWRASASSTTEEGKASLERLDFYRRQGFGAISAIGGSIRFGGQQLDATHRTRIVAKMPLGKGLRMLDFAEDADLSPNAFVPASADSVAVFHWNIGAAVAGYGSAYDEIYGEDYQGAFDELLDSVENEAEGPEAKVRQDILQRLSSKVVAISDHGGEQTKANPSGRRTLACRTNDAVKTETAIERFFAGERDIDVASDNGVRVWQGKTSQVGLLGSDPENPFSVDIDAVCVADDHLMIATDRTLLHEVLEQIAQGKTSRPFDAFFESDPAADKSCARVFRNLESALEETFTRMRTGDATKPEAGLVPILDFLFSSGTGGGSTEGKHLPNYRAVRGHVGAETLDIQPLGDGWLIRGLARRAAP